MSILPRDAGDEEDNETFKCVHGTVMIFTWMIFASTAILFARYGRAISFGSKKKFLGEKIWFQFHRFIACLTTVLTLLGFFFILVHTKAEWVGSDEGLAFAHSVVGGIVVCCALLQAWMALFRCHPGSSFRFIFNWIHRLTGSLAFFLSIPTLLLIAAHMDESRRGMIAILSIWSSWVVSIVIVLEIIRFRYRKLFSTHINERNGVELYDLNAPNDVPTTKSDDNDTAPCNKPILIFFLLHIGVSIALVIPFIVLIWK